MNEPLSEKKKQWSVKKKDVISRSEVNTNKLAQGNVEVRTCEARLVVVVGATHTHLLE